MIDKFHLRRYSRYLAVAIKGTVFRGELPFDKKVKPICSHDNHFQSRRRYTKDEDMDQAQGLSSVEKNFCV